MRDCGDERGLYTASQSPSNTGTGLSARADTEQLLRRFDAAISEARSAACGRAGADSQRAGGGARDARRDAAPLTSNLLLEKFDAAIAAARADCSVQGTQEESPQRERGPDQNQAASAWDGAGEQGDRLSGDQTESQADEVELGQHLEAFNSATEARADVTSAETGQAMSQPFSLDAIDLQDDEAMATYPPVAPPLAMQSQRTGGKESTPAVPSGSLCADENRVPESSEARGHADVADQPPEPVEVGQAGGRPSGIDPIDTPERLSFSRAKTMKTGKAFKASVSAQQGVKGRSAMGTKVNESSKSWLFCYATTSGITFTATKARDEAIDERDASLRRHVANADQVYRDPSYRKKLDDACFAFVWKEKFSEPQGNTKIKFKDYASEVFRDLRVLYGVDDASYLRSINGGQLSEIGTAETGSKSGQKFLITSDGRYFMKTITKGEAKFFRKVLRPYYEHMVESQNTLLCRFFGLHRLKHPSWGKLYLIIMSNIFDTERVINTRYDLKGSTVGRAVSEYEKKQPTTIYKDLDFLQMQKTIEVGARRRQAVLEVMKSDCDWLARIGVLDYSLLLGVHQRNSVEKPGMPASNGPLSSKPAQTHHTLAPLGAFGAMSFGDGGREGESWAGAIAQAAALAVALEQEGEDAGLHGATQSVKKRLAIAKTGSLFMHTAEATHVSALQQDDGGLCSAKMVNGQMVAGDQIYFFGIVDFLQTYTLKKFLETNSKSLVYKRDQLSAVPPRQYAQRFHRFMASIFE